MKRQMRIKDMMSKSRMQTKMTDGSKIDLPEVMFKMPDLGDNLDLNDDSLAVSRYFPGSPEKGGGGKSGLRRTKTNPLKMTLQGTKEFFQKLGLDCEIPPDKRKRLK